MSGDEHRDASRDSTDTTVSLRPAVPWLLAMVALGIAAVVVGIVRLDELPREYPVHFGPAGDPDRFSDKSLSNVLLPAVVGQLSGLSLFATLALVRPRGPARVVAPLAALGFVIGGGLALVSIAQYLSADAVPPGWTFWLLLAAIIAGTVWVVVAAVHAARGVPVGEETANDREGWKWGGLVYADPHNPDVFVPKRVGTGVTINFGRPLGWVVMGLVLLPGVIIIVAVTVGT